LSLDSLIRREDRGESATKRDVRDACDATRDERTVVVVNVCTAIVRLYKDGEVRVCLESWEVCREAGPELLRAVPSVSQPYLGFVRSPTRKSVK
jgi:uncharacterized protein (DUF849 family)